MECCPSFQLISAKDRPRLVNKRRQQRVLYFYFLDPALGLIHIRLTTWFPFTVQIYVNGHSWLAQQMLKRRLGFNIQDNAFTALDDPKAAQKLADSFALNPGSIVTMDRGYADYALFGRWTIAGVFFVTRLKDNAAFAIEAEFATPENRPIRSDQIIRLTGVQALTDCPGPLRRVVVWDADNEREIVLLTNLLEFGATTIAAIYKERWQIELFFKALKQTAKVKSFLGASANAVKTQIWTALIAMLILKYLQMKSSFGWSLSNLAALLRQQLFIFRDLWAWLNNPLEGPPAARQLAEQLPMPLVW